METYDLIVVGVGSMGSATCYALAGRGLKVLGIERHRLGHEFGSHLGQSRLIRKAYFEHADYVPLLQRAYELWDEVEAQTGCQLFYRTGLLYHGRPDHDLISGSLYSAATYRIEMQEINPAEVHKAYPQFTLPPDYVSYLEPDAGFLRPELAIQMMGAFAQSHGVDLHFDEWMTDYVRSGQGWAVHTNRAVYSCEKLIITSGAWTSRLLPQLTLHLRVTRQILGWLHKKSGPGVSLQQFPCWILADDTLGGAFYGFPELPPDPFGMPSGFKIAHHHPGMEILPEDKDQSIQAHELEALEYGLRVYLGEVKGSWSSFQHCMYTMSPDEHFVLDQLPGHPGVWIAAGFSGHGFKFAPVIGEIMADLATSASSALPISFLSLKRFQKPENPFHR
ncbi:MAG: N-methyl-L-tryptophan oxidase [Saprospiraceae bacterium]